MQFGSTAAAEWEADPSSHRHPRRLELSPRTVTDRLAVAVGTTSAPTAVRRTSENRAALESHVATRKTGNGGHGMTETQLVIDGLGFPESTRWHDGRVWLCNWGA